MWKCVLRRSALAAGLCLLPTACWPSGAAAVLLSRGGNGGSGPDRNLAGSIVVSSAGGASLDLDDEAEPNDRRGDARRLQVPERGVRVVRGVASAGRRWITLHGAGAGALRKAEELRPGVSPGPQVLPAGRPDFAPRWITAGPPGVLLLQDEDGWQAELQGEHRTEAIARWRRPAAGQVRGITLVEDLLFVLTAEQDQRVLWTLDPWTGRTLGRQPLGAVDWSGLAAGMDPERGSVRLLTLAADAGRWMGAWLREEGEDLLLDPFEELGACPTDLRAESLAFDGDLAWLLDEDGAAHGWCLSANRRVALRPADGSGAPARRLVVRTVTDQDAVHLVVEPGAAVRLQWWAAADDLVQLEVLDRGAALEGGEETRVASRQVTGPLPRQQTLVLEAASSARTYDLLLHCRSGAASWALVLGADVEDVALPPLPPPPDALLASTLSVHDAGHPGHWRHAVARLGRPGFQGPMDDQVAIGELDAPVDLPQALADCLLREHHRSPAGYRVMDLDLRITTEEQDRFLGTPRPGARQRLRARRLLRLVDALERRPGVAWAEVVPRARALGVTPNDPLWNRQRWAHAALNLPQAWTYTQGSPAVVVGVVDTGIRTEHDDLSPVVLPGYDFVDNTRNSGDGDGMDPDPYDDGGYDSHGTHVAGTIAARGNDGFGISGVVLDGSLLPVRAIGVDGTGNLSDVAEAILFAAGLPNRSGRLPATPCQVLNLSLGSSSDYTPLRQAVTAALDAGVVVVAAAGNDGGPGLLYPAAYARVIAVGASTIDDQRAPYSNTGARLDVLAPGGGYGDLDGNGQPDQIYSSIGDPNGARPGGFQYLMGTSMACAHASGVAALLRALKPDATPADVATLMTSTARDLGAPGFDGNHGYGLLDAHAAMQQINPILSLNTDAVDLGDNGTAFVVQMDNLGGGTLTIDGLTTTPVLGPGGWLSATALPDGVSLALTVDRTGLAPGPHALDLLVSSSGGDQTLPITLNVTQAPLPDFGEVLVEVRTPEGTLVRRMRTRVAQGYQWSLGELPLGSYQLHCGVDLDGDGVLGEPGEPYGVYPAVRLPTPIQLQVRRLVTDLVLE